MKRLILSINLFIAIDLLIVAIHFFIAKYNISVGMITPENPIWIFRNELILSFITIAVATILVRHFKWRKNIALILTNILFFRLLFRLIDILFIFNYGNHFTSLIYSDIDLASVLNYLTLFSYIQIILVIYLSILLYRYIKVFCNWLIAEQSLKQTEFYSVLGTLMILVLLIASGTKQTADYLVNYTTEAIIINETSSYFFPVQNYYELDIKLTEKLKQFGLSTDRNFIKIKDQIFSDSLKLFRLENSRPNILFYILESSTQNLVSYFNPDIEGLTPNMDTFFEDKNTVVFPNAVNTGVPSLNSLFSLFFSFYSMISHEDVRESNIVFRDGFFSIATVLNENGYNCYYLTGISKTFTQTGRILGNSGFSVYDIEDVRSALEEEPLSWGYSDHQMTRYYDYFIKNIAKKPYFIAVTTIDGHKPYVSYSDTKNYKTGEDPILNVNHSTDDAFGQLVSSLKEINQLDSMLLIVTGDHPPHPTISYTGVLQEKRKTHISYNEFVPFGIRFPDAQFQREISTFFPSISFAPTLLHILNINSNNLFEAGSIFESDQNQLQYFNTIYDINFYNKLFSKIKIEIKQDEVNQYIEWRRATFLETYHRQKKKMLDRKRSKNKAIAYKR